MSIPTRTPPMELIARRSRTIPRASGAAVTDILVLADGTRLRFRPLISDDRDRLSGLFDRLTPASRRLRFLSPKRNLTARELAYLTDIDHVRHEAIAAVDQRDCSIVGVARYVHVADRRGVADVAVEVADEMQSMGVGTELAARLVERARANGFTLLTATTLWENRRARATATPQIPRPREPTSDCHGTVPSHTGVPGAARRRHPGSACRGHKGPR